MVKAAWRFLNEPTVSINRMAFLIVVLETVRFVHQETGWSEWLATLPVLAAYAILYTCYLTVGDWLKHKFKHKRHSVAP